jgi:hypothetical protein
MLYEQMKDVLELELLELELLDFACHLGDEFLKHARDPAESGQKANARPLGPGVSDPNYNREGAEGE